MARFNMSPREPTLDVLIPIREYTREQVPLSGRLEETAGISSDEVEAFDADLSGYVKQTQFFNSYQIALAHALRQNADLFFDLMRVEKVKVNLVYDGALSMRASMMMVPVMRFLPARKHIVAGAGSPGIWAPWYDLRCDRYAAAIWFGEFMPYDKRPEHFAYRIMKDQAGSFVSQPAHVAGIERALLFVEPVCQLGEHIVQFDHFYRPDHGEFDPALLIGMAIVRTQVVRDNTQNIFEGLPMPEFNSDFLVYEPAKDKDNEKDKDIHLQQNLSATLEKICTRLDHIEAVVDEKNGNRKITDQDGRWNKIGESLPAKVRKVKKVKSTPEGPEVEGDEDDDPQ